MQMVGPEYELTLDVKRDGNNEELLFKD